VTAAGLLLGSCAGLLAARRLCATNTRKRAGEGGPEAAQASWEREGSLSSQPRLPSGLVAKRHQHHHTPMCHFIRENLTIPSIQRADLTLHRRKSVNFAAKTRPTTILEMALRYLLCLAYVADYYSCDGSPSLFCLISRIASSKWSQFS
jgi:hypothetical protein